MKLLCVIDSLGSGGAQRQIVNIATSLKKRGHEIRFLLYYDNNHFLPMLEKEKIEYKIIKKCSHLQRMIEIRNELRKSWQDVVLAFLEGSILYAELAKIPKNNWGLVVGERSANPDIKKGMRPIYRQFHRYADYIVCNSYTNELMLRKKFPFLSEKIFTIYNTVDNKKFSSNESNILYNERNTPVRIIVAASYHENKNMFGLAKAVALLKKRNYNNFVIDWYGAVQNDKSPYEKACEFIKNNQIDHLIRLHEKVRDIDKKIKQSDVIGLFSFFEGLPNVICEGMACGKAIIMSDVCDATNLVSDGVNGYLFNPESVEDIAEKIKKVIELTDIQRNKMGNISKIKADLLFDENEIINRYEMILIAAYKKIKLNQDLSWPNIIPISAERTVEKW